MECKKTATALVLLVIGIAVALATPDLAPAAAAGPAKDSFLLAVRVLVGVALVGIVMVMVRSGRNPEGRRRGRERDQWH